MTSGPKPAFFRAARNIVFIPEIFGSERLTGALLDRLTHHVHILEMTGESYRLNQSKNSGNPKNPCITAAAMVNAVGPVLHRPLDKFYSAVDIYGLYLLVTPVIARPPQGPLN